ncbi:class I SAM-dependent methyltransferase [Nonomuraea sp. NPDC050310]|uniref:class I SAM-dependent methyltransferase n=1 Tax=Nonomuraea sp. NPDC050310 TaxID=3154935 RepID=UPI0033F3A1E7
MTTLCPEYARAWLRRWDAQQERYVAERERRFEVVGDVLRHALADRPRPLVLDLGCGPGSLAVRLARRLPDARVIGVDTDPLLLALGRSAYPEVARFAEADLRRPGWTARLGLEEAADAVVSATALHYLPVADLAAVYEELAGLIRPGGLFVNADNLYDEQPAIAALAAAVRGERVGDGEDWASWWRAAGQDPVLAPLVAAREAGGTVEGDHRVSVAVHAALLRQAGFAQVGTVWQTGDDVVLAAVRQAP